MKLNKAFIAAALALGTLLAGSLATQAQDNTNTPPAGTPPGGGMRRPGMTFDAIAKRLELTDDQKPKAEPIIKDFIQKMGDLRSDTTLSREDRTAKTKVLRDDATAKLKGILTADQLTKWQQMGSRRPNGAGAGGPPAGAPSASNPPADAPKN